MSTIAERSANTLVVGRVSHYHFYQPMNFTSRRSQKYQPTKAIIPSVPRQHSKAPSNSPLSFIRPHKLPRQEIPAATTSAVIITPPQPSLSSSTDTQASSELSSSSPPSSSSATAIPTSQSQRQQQQQQIPLFESSANVSQQHQLTNKHPYALSKCRPRKVSFEEKVMVICTRFDVDEDEDEDEDEEEADEYHHSSEIWSSMATSNPVYLGRRHSTGEHMTDAQRQRKRWLPFVKTLKQWKHTVSVTSSSASAVI